jgi:hypothetical protein
MKHKIRKKFHHKNYVFLLSVAEGHAIWSVHEYDGDNKITYAELSALFQKDHDRQVDQLIQESLKDDPVEFTEETILDLTENINKDEKLL